MFTFTDHALDATALNGVYTPPSIEEQPDVILISWSIFSVSNEPKPNTIHFVGYNVLTYDGRVSSAVVSFNKETKVGITQSGRRYKLLDGPGANSDASYVWGQWKTINGVDNSDVTDITKEYYEPQTREVQESKGGMPNVQAEQDDRLE